MPRIPVVRGRDVIKALVRGGFQVVGRSGSHVRPHGDRRGAARVVIVPDHPEVARGTLASILRQAGMTREDFMRLLR